MYRIWSGSISRRRLAVPWPPPMSATRPTCTPRIFTLAPASMTSPARSEVTVTGTYDRNVPAKAVPVTKKKTAIAVTKMTVHQPSERRFSPGRVSISPRQVEVARLPVDRQRDHHDLDRRDDHRRAYRTPDRLAHAGRSALRREAVIGVHQHDHDRYRDRLNERPDHVGGIEEGVEVVVVHAGALPVDGDRAGPRGEEGHHDGDAVQRDDDDDAGQHAGRGKIGDRPDPDDLERVDLLIDPHRAELGGGPCADSRRQGDGDGPGHDEANVEKRRCETGQRLET